MVLNNKKLLTIAILGLLIATVAYAETGIQNYLNTYYFNSSTTTGNVTNNIFINTTNPTVNITQFNNVTGGNASYPIDLSNESKVSNVLGLSHIPAIPESQITNLQNDLNSKFNSSNTTNNLSEGSNNLYFTNARARAAVSNGTSSVLTFNTALGVFDIKLPSCTGNNFYQTLDGVNFTCSASSNYNATYDAKGNASYPLNVSNTTGTLPNASIPLSAMNVSSTRIMISSFTKDMSLASGTQSVTGVGFEPVLVKFTATINGVANAASWGANTNISSWVMLDDSSDTNNAYYTFSGRAIQLQPTAGNGQYAVIQSMSGDGFTLSWTKYGTPSGTATILYEAYK